MKNEIKKIALAMTGASGIPYAVRLLECLANEEIKIYLLVSQAAHVVIAMEHDTAWPTHPAQLQSFLIEKYPALANKLEVFSEKQWTAPIASGSGAPDAMVICPCTSGALAAIACGMSDNLIERAADVVIKEKKKLILVHRETPLSDIHLENLLKLSRCGAVILPANPGFYHKPESIADLVNFIVGRILDHLDIKQTLHPRWGNEEA